MLDCCTLLGLSNGYVGSLSSLRYTYYTSLAMYCLALLTASLSPSQTNSAPSVGLFLAENNDAVNFLGRCQRPVHKCSPFAQSTMKEMILSFFYWLSYYTENPYPHFDWEISRGDTSLSLNICLPLLILIPTFNFVVEEDTGKIHALEAPGWAILSLSDHTQEASHNAVNEWQSHWWWWSTITEATVLDDKEIIWHLTNT